jgi:hypothetical protein
MYQSVFALFRAERMADSELCMVRVTSDQDSAPFRIKLFIRPLYKCSHKISHFWHAYYYFKSFRCWCWLLKATLVFWLGPNWAFVRVLRIGPSWTNGEVDFLESICLRHGWNTNVPFHLDCVIQKTCEPVTGGERTPMAWTKSMVEHIKLLGIQEFGRKCI